MTIPQRVGMKRTATYMVRGALIGCIFAMTVWCWQVLRPARSGAIADITPPTPGAEALHQLPATPLSSVDWIAGHWQFGPSRWSIGIRPVVDADAEDAILSADVDDAEPVCAHAAEDQKILDIFAGLGSRQETSSGVCRHALTWGGMRAVADVREIAGTQRIVRLAAVFEVEQKRQLLEILAAPRTDPSANAHVQTILPLPVKSEIMAIRYDAQGRACCVVAQMGIEISALCVDLRGSGWQVESGPTGSWICRRAGVTALLRVLAGPQSDPWVWFVLLPDDGLPKSTL